MKKLSLIAITLFFATLASSQVVSPVIVANGKLLGMNSGFSQTVFTPSQSGVYRVSVYLAVTAQGAGTASWSVAARWTDDAGREGGLASGFLLQVDDNQTPPKAGGQASRVIEATAGSPIVVDVRGAKPADGSTINFYYVVEQLFVF